MRRGIFLVTALFILFVDRVSKVSVSGALSDGAPLELLGSSLRLIRSENRGGLFGLFQGSAPLLALLSLGVVALLVVMHEREGKLGPSLMTLATGLLVGGAIGNLFDRLTYGYVFDFIDVGVGSMRFWTFNAADMGISFGILVMLVAALRPSVTRQRSATDE